MSVVAITHVNTLFVVTLQFAGDVMSRRRVIEDTDREVITELVEKYNLDAKTIAEKFDCRQQRLIGTLKSGK